MPRAAASPRGAELLTARLGLRSGWELLRAVGVVMRGATLALASSALRGRMGGERLLLLLLHSGRRGCIWKATLMRGKGALLPPLILQPTGSP